MNIRVAPQAVCRQLLANLNRYKPLTASEEESLLVAIENSHVPDAVTRLMADLSRNALQQVIDQT